MSFAPLFEPLVLPQSGLELANRLVMAPMPTFAAEPGGAASDAEIAYYRRRGAGGLAAVITAGCAVSADGVSFEGQWRCDRNGLVSSLARVAEAIQAGRSLAVLQLCRHGGSEPERAGAARLAGAFAAAARRARQAGFDAVELHGGHRYALQQVFSPAANPGKSFERRAALLVAAAHAAAEAFGGPLWMRLDPEEADPAGYGFAELCRLADLLAGCGVEVFDIAAPDYFAGSIRDPGDRRPLAMQLEQRLDRPTIAVGGIATPAQALATRRDGCSLVGLGRILLVEPEWARCVAAGQAEGLALELDSDARLKSADTPAAVIDYLRRKAAERKISQ